MVVVGGGVSGLSAAIRLKQLEEKHKSFSSDGEIISSLRRGSTVGAYQSLRIAVVEKASEIGGHILSGACIHPRSLHELFPSWTFASEPIDTWTPVSSERMYLLRPPGKWNPPGMPWLPPCLSHHGCYVGSLGAFTKWLSDKAEEMGVEVYPGVAASELLLHEDESGSDTLRGSEKKSVVEGVQLNDVGLDASGKETDRYEPGMIFKAKQTIFAEGCRGSCTKLLERRLGLRPPISSRPKHHQTYGLGIKEVWEVPPSHHKPGRVEHMIGWPLTRGEGFDGNTYGGGFLYHYGKNLVSCGLVIGLDYRHPHCSPYKEMQKWKLHPRVRSVLEGGRPLWYGARTISEGGLAALPTLTFPGGLLVGDCAGFLNLPRIQGVHGAMKSGMLAAEAIFEEVFLHPREEKGSSESSRASSLSPFTSAGTITASPGATTTVSSSSCADRTEKTPNTHGGGTVKEPEEASDEEEKMDNKNAKMGIECTSYPERFKKSWLYKELYQFRNVRQVFQRNFYLGLMYTGITSLLTFGKEPWTLSHGTPDHLCLRGIAEMKGIQEENTPQVVAMAVGVARDEKTKEEGDAKNEKREVTKEKKSEAMTTPSTRSTTNNSSSPTPTTTPSTSNISSPGFPLKSYPKPDNTLTFDLPTSLSLSGTSHNEQQPCHLHLMDPAIPTSLNWKLYGGPEAHFCPAGVYEYDENGKLQIHAANCLHCKACDIKDPAQNIQWTPPEGGGGPSYHYQM